MMQYQWKSQSNLKADPQRVGERLEQIRERSGGFLTPETIVADAAHARSPLRECFEWNDKKAAVAHRLDQARYIMRQLVVTVEIVDREPAVVRAFVSVDPGDQGDTENAYTSIQRALEEPTLRQQVIAQARKDFLSLRRKYAELTELSDVFRAIDQLPLAAEAPTT